MARIAVLMSFSGAGGVERMVTNLLGGFIARGHQVDLLAIRPDMAHLPDSAGIALHRLGAHTHTSLPALLRYLRRTPPDAMLAAKDRAIRLAVVARALSGQRFPLAGRLGTNLSAAMQGKPAWQRWAREAPMRALYRWVDRIVAVSAGVAEDTLAITGLPTTRVCVVRNPVVTPSFATLAAQPPSHPWLASPEGPVIVGAGRLTRQKDFHTLVQAFAQVRARRPCRLVIFGEGSERAALEQAIRECGVSGEVALPGHTANPYADMSRASVFVLSSRWEGSPNVLTEALALGVPVVATDCPSGPREILRGGQVAPLVAMGQAEEMAAAITRMLDNPPAAASLREAARDYTVDASTAGYLAALGLAQSP